METNSEDSASDKEGDEHASAESGDEIMDETIPPSPGKVRTRSKARKVIIPAPVMCSDSESEDEEHRPQPRKRTNASPAPLRAGGTFNFFRRNSNQFPSIASKKLAACKGRAGIQGQKSLVSPLSFLSSIAGPTFTSRRSLIPMTNPTPNMATLQSWQSLRGSM